jgi:hypothetical protein
LTVTTSRRPTPLLEMSVSVAVSIAHCSLPDVNPVVETRRRWQWRAPTTKYGDTAELGHPPGRHPLAASEGDRPLAGGAPVMREKGLC